MNESSHHTYKVKPTQDYLVHVEGLVHPILKASEAPLVVHRRALLLVVLLDGLHDRGVRVDAIRKGHGPKRLRVIKNMALYTCTL